ncbi:MAG: cytochrome c oxidase subunit 3 [Saprospiraceae bacterium]|nr:cytochrome c oxidase subunit 3 [Saprospiraceae bacterium]
MPQSRNNFVHPHYIIITLIIGGITALFLGFTFSYLYNRVQQGVLPVVIPSLFYFNTILIIGSSCTLMVAKRAYLKDKTTLYKMALWVTLILSFLFLYMQILAWKQLVSSNISLNHSTMASYLYLISGLHFLHLLAGIPFLIKFIYIAQKRMVDPVTVLVYFSDPDKKRDLHILNIYWHFLDGLWIYLVIFFLINYII